MVGSTLLLMTIVTGITLVEYRKYMKQVKINNSSKSFKEYVEGKFGSKKKQQYDTEEFKENLGILEEIIEENK